MVAEFSISEAPIADALTGAAAFGPSVQFDAQDVKFRYGERYISESANQKFLGIPLGIYLGLIPSFENNILTLGVDPTLGVSLARLISQEDPLYSVDIIIDAAVTLDFTNHSLFPVNVVLKARGRLGFAHSAEIVTQTATPGFPTEILLGVVTGVDTISVIEPFNRDTPFAYSGAPLGYGFMKSGGVEDLLNSIAMSAEVINARTDLAGTVHPDLVTRLDTDGSALAISERLGRETKTIFGDSFAIVSPTDQLNVSRAFSALHRSIAGNSPSVDFEGFASEARSGAVTSGTIPLPAAAGTLTDSERNACAIIDGLTEERFTSNDRQVAFGRLSLDEATLSGTEISFSIGSPTVTGIGTLFTVEVEAGDIIQDPSGGNFYEVLTTPVFDTTLTLSVNAVVSSAPLTPPGLRRRFTMNARTRTGPTTDTAFTLPSGVTAQVYFTAWRTLNTAQYDYLPRLFREFEEAPIRPATTLLEGKALIVPGASEALAGAVFEIQEQGTLVDQQHIHTIDFNGAALVTPGIADVTQRGPIGPVGPPGGGGAPGPVGPQGPQGQGFSNFSTSNLFELSAPFNHSALGAGVQYTFTTTMSGTEILFLTGGNATWDENGGAVVSNDHFQIDDIFIVGGTGMQVRMNLTSPGGDVTMTYFMNAATR